MLGKEAQWSETVLNSIMVLLFIMVFAFWFCFVSFLSVQFYSPNFNFHFFCITLFKQKSAIRRYCIRIL